MSTMVLDGLRFLEFVGPLKPTIHPFTPKGPIGPRAAEFAHPSLETYPKHYSGILFGIQLGAR